MNQRKYQFGSAAVRNVAASAILALAGFAAVPALAVKASDVARVEMRIMDMHARLKITTAQEDQWAKVVDVMRDNANRLDELTEARTARSKTMNAVDDLNSYSEISEVHAEGVKRFTAVFATLYAGMPDAQKAQVDLMFRRGDVKRHQKAHKEMHDQ